MLVFVIPTFRPCSVGGLELPLPTRVGIGMSDFLIGYWWAILGMGGRIFALKSYSRHGPGLPPDRRAMLKAPILGDVIRIGGVASPGRWARW